MPLSAADKTHDTAIVAFFKIPLALSATVFPNNLILYLKYLKLSVFAVLTLKSLASSFE